MYTGTEYRESLRDGRQVWILGEGPIEDVTTHPLTAPLVDFYAAWYDRHRDPEWADLLLTPPDETGTRRPVVFEIPRSAEDLRRIGQAVYRVEFLSAGNVTHTPADGGMIALGIVDAVKTLGLSRERVAAAEAYRDLVAREGRFITFAAGVLPPGDRFRPPEEREVVHVVRETDGGVIVRGMVGNHTATPYLHDVFVSGGTRSPVPDQRVWFSVPVNAPGVRVVARKAAVRHPNRFLSPLSSRFDELDAQLWFDDVFIPWERVFAYREEVPERPPMPTWELIATWLYWQQQLAWLAHADFTLGLALAVADTLGLGALGPGAAPEVVEQLVDLIIDVETVRSCVTAAELDPIVTPAGYTAPNILHLAPGKIYHLKHRQRMTDILRNLAGQAGVLCPADTDLADPRMAEGLERAFGGGGYTALQRAALMQLVSDHIASALDGRQAAFELHCNGGVMGWRNRIQRWFARYNELANGVLSVLDVQMPTINLEHLREIPTLRRTWANVIHPGSPAGSGGPTGRAP